MGDSIFPILTKLRSEHSKNILLGHLNINSVRNKFESSNEMIRNNFDIFVITERKLDTSFQDSQFHIPGYRLFRKDRNKNGGGLMCYINRDLPVKIVTNNKFLTNLEVLSIKKTVGKRKILVVGIYRPPSYSENNFLFHLENTLSQDTTTYENITSIGGFKMNPDENRFLDNFNKTFNLKNSINEPTCFKSQNPSMIELILSNHRNFMKTVVLEIGILDHYKMIFSILKHNFAKSQLKTIYYRDLKKFDQKVFNSYLQSKMADYPKKKLSFEKFLQMFQDTVQLFAFLKKKIIRYIN